MIALMSYACLSIQYWVSVSFSVDIQRGLHEDLPRIFQLWDLLVRSEDCPEDEGITSVPMDCGNPWSLSSLHSWILYKSPKERHCCWIRFWILLSNADSQYRRLNSSSLGKFPLSTTCLLLPDSGPCRTWINVEQKLWSQWKRVKVCFCIIMNRRWRRNR